MRAVEQIGKKIMSLAQAKVFMQVCKTTGKTVAFTNGCFDILHLGHVNYLAASSDASVKKLKGPERPIHSESSRASILANLVLVDVVVVFEEETPLQLIQTLLPDVLVKGGDYTNETIVGAKEVIANGGKVIINPIVEGFSTTNIIEKIKK